MADGVCLYCGARVDVNVIACRACNSALDIVLPPANPEPAIKAPAPASIRAPRSREALDPASALICGIACFLGVGSILGSGWYFFLGLVGSSHGSGGAGSVITFLMGPGLFVVAGILGFTRPRLAGSLLVVGAAASSLWVLILGFALFDASDWRWTFLFAFVPMLIVGLSLLGLAASKTHPLLDPGLRARAPAIVLAVVVILLLADGGIAYWVANPRDDPPPYQDVRYVPVAAPVEEKTPEANLERVNEVGGRGGGLFQEVAPGSGLLVGLRATISWFDGHEIIKSLVPQYRVGEATVSGRVHGDPLGRMQETIAQPGYAIGALVAQGGERVNGFRVVFMKVAGDALDPRERYEGVWIGGRGAGPEVFLGREGTPVIGISGREGADVDALSLVLSSNATLDASLVAVNGEGFIRRWLFLGALPLGDLASDQNAALNKRWIPDLEGVKPAQHDRILVDGREYRWRVGDIVDYYLPLDAVDNSATIAISYVVADSDIADATLLTGSDDSAVWYLNGREVQRFVGPRAVGKDQERTAQPVALRKGMNLLVAVVINGGGPTSACARFVDSTGRPLKLRAGATLPAVDGDPSLPLPPPKK
jgi:hypothetical protein